MHNPVVIDFETRDYIFTDTQDFNMAHPPVIIYHMIAVKRPFDIAMLECGQYNASWPNIHMMPEEAVQAALDLKTDVLMPVHWGKFTLAYHPWNEPVERAVKNAAERQVKVTTPMIGEPVMLGEKLPEGMWWNV